MIGFDRDCPYLSLSLLCACGVSWHKYTVLQLNTIFIAIEDWTRGKSYTFSLPKLNADSHFWGIKEKHTGNTLKENFNSYCPLQKVTVDILLIQFHHDTIFVARWDERLADC